MGKKIKYTLFPFLPAAIIGAYALFSLYRLADVPPVWSDEIIHLNTALHVAKEGMIWCNFYDGELSGTRLYISMPVQWLILAAFIKIFGLTLFKTRLLYLLISACSLAMLYALAKRMFGRGTALFALLLTSSTYIFFHTSRQNMPQVPALAFMLASLLCFYTGRDKKNAALFAAAGSSAALAYLCHPVGITALLSVAVLLIYTKSSRLYFSFFIAGALIPIALYLIHILKDFRAYTEHTSFVLDIYYRTPVFINMINEILVRYLGLGYLTDSNLSYGLAWHVRHILKWLSRIDLRIFLCELYGKAAFLTASAYLLLKKGKTRPEKELLIILATGALIFSIHPNKFGLYLYALVPFFAISIALLTHDLIGPGRPLPGGARKVRFLAMALFVGLYLAVNLTLSYKEVTTKRILSYDYFVKKMAAVIPRGAVVAGPNYFWLGMQGDHRFVSSSEITYAIRNILRDEYGGAAPSRLSQKEMDGVIRRVLSKRGVQYVLLTWHPWEAITDEAGIATKLDGLTEQHIRRYLFNNADKIADYVRLNYFPGLPEARVWNDEVWFPPPDVTVRFYNVTSEYQNTLKIYKIR